MKCLDNTPGRTWSPKKHSWKMRGDPTSKRSRPLFHSTPRDDTEPRLSWFHTAHTPRRCMLGLVFLAYLGGRTIAPYIFSTRSPTKNSLRISAPRFPVVPREGCAQFYSKGVRWLPCETIDGVHTPQRGESLFGRLCGHCL